ncbi:Fic family protein [Terrabacter sp. MAHUQ-38]|uniref:Fic family protein n=1 Tax=unclassified Terrabacter TaxID=2630222 RepID=UPI00165DE154|nr:Fic family protein [Terrabacter sp. MAHUQ-38]MBC9823466.1 Fic family protein [Terrabacter sp. MAHUQ-38]
MVTTWPALGARTVPWQPIEGLLDLSRRALRSTPASFDAAVVPEIAPVELVLPGDLAADLDEATRMLAAFDAGGAGEIAPFASVLLRSESAASSQIENLTSSARALAEAEIGEGNRANAAVILGNVRTMQAALELAGRLDEDAVLAMHRALMAHQSRHPAGQWRDQQVWVGGSPLHPGEAQYVPPLAVDVPGLMADLVRFMDRDDLPPLAHAALAHAQFETIHPFTDGNGRTGRALLHSVLLHTGAIRRVTVPISAGLLAIRDDYFDALTAYRGGDVEPILRCVAEAARNGTHIGERLVGTLREVRADWAVQLTARAGSASWAMLDLLLRQPVVTARVVVRELGVSAPTAQSALQRLVDDGILFESTGHRRNRVYRAPAVLRALDGYAAGLGRRMR